jgi:flagellar biosynthesis protein FliP
MMTYLPTHPTRALRRHFFAFFTTIWVFALAQPCQDATTIQPTTTAKAFNATTTMQTCYVLTLTLLGLSSYLILLAATREIPFARESCK